MVEMCPVFCYCLLWLDALETIDLCIWRFSLVVLKYVVCLCKGCDGCCVLLCFLFLL